MAGRDPYGVLHAALAGTGARALPYEAANAGDSGASAHIERFFRELVLPRLEQLVATGAGPQLQPPGAQFGLRSPFPAPSRPRPVEVRAARADMETIRGYLMSSLRARQGLQKHPLWGGIVGDLANELSLDRGIPNA